MADHIELINKLNDAIDELIQMGKSLKEEDIKYIQKLNKCLNLISLQICMEKLQMGSLYGYMLSYPFDTLFNIYDKAFKVVTFDWKCDGYEMTLAEKKAEEILIDSKETFPFELIQNTKIKEYGMNNLKKLREKND
jgi:hypothetical protein